MADQDFIVRYYYMAIDGLEGERFIVAKLRRVSSPPIQVGTVRDSMASALGRLVDIIRLGSESRNYADLKAVESSLVPNIMVSADAEWASYEQLIVGGLGVERLERFPLTATRWSSGGQLPGLPVTFHEAEMNDKPYLVAKVGSVFGSPAPELLTYPRHRQSALARLRDVFRIGVRGQVFRDFVELGRRLGKKEADILKEWRECEQAVERASGQLLGSKLPP